jgi:flavodoxin
MINTTLYYFTGTGNSLVVARKIAQKIGDTELIHIANQKNTKPSINSTSIGIIFPVYIFGIPLIIKRFIEKIEIPKNAYIFAVATHAGMPCSTLVQTAQQFSKRGLVLSAGFEILMIDNATMIADTISQEKQKKRFNKAELKINHICEAINKKEKYIYRGLPIINWFFGNIYKNAVPNWPGFDKNFSVDPNCNGCVYVNKSVL